MRRLCALAALILGLTAVPAAATSAAAVAAPAAAQSTGTAHPTDWWW